MNQTMKKIQSICIVALLAAFALTSCNYTDLDPTDMVGPDKAFGNVQNVHKAVVGIYGKASLRSKLAVTEYIADDCVQGGDSGGAGTDLAGWVYTATSGDVSGLWAHYYGIINQANRVLNYGPKVKPGADLGTKLCFGTIAATVCDYLGVPAEKLDGKSVLADILK